MISVKDVNYRYPKAKSNVLNDITMSFDQGKVNVIAGLNGAGKTTLFDLITGVYPIQNGEFQNVPKMDDILYQIQGTFLSQMILGRDYARLVYKISGKKFQKGSPSAFIDLGDQRENTLLERLWNRELGQMSVGERRWLYVTLLSQLDRKMYLFDEPTSAIDPSSRLKICKRLERLAKEPGKTVIMSSHHLHELEFIACKLFVMNNGSVTFQGSYHEFLSTFETTNPDIAFDHCINL
ncbi:AAA family ATPase [Bacillus spongiae]|uniref:AAA family ATPase n=1 Tax=Bacillus spongiae TaxID=2683610 RepID=A0ABU8HHP7_9BACI